MSAREYASPKSRRDAARKRDRRRVNSVWVPKFKVIIHWLLTGRTVPAPRLEWHHRSGWSPCGSKVSKLYSRTTPRIMQELVWCVPLEVGQHERLHGLLTSLSTLPAAQRVTLQSTNRRPIARARNASNSEHAAR